MLHIEDNTLALRFESYPGDLPFLEAFLTPRFVEHDAACIILVISFTSIQI